MQPAPNNIVTFHNGGREIINASMELSAMLQYMEIDDTFDATYYANVPDEEED